MTESWWSPATEAILDALSEAERPLRLADLVDQSVGGLSRPGLYHNLQRLVQAGLVVRTGAQKNARYAPEERVSIQWTARLGDRWKRMAWTCTPPISWRFPLTTRLESATSRDATLQFLEGMEADLLHRPDGWMKGTGWTPEALAGLVEHSGPREAQGLPLEQHRAAYLHLTSPTNYGPCIVAVFGSAARGRDRANSDVDVLVVLPTLQRFPEDQDVEQLTRTVESKVRTDLAEALRDLAAEVNLTHARTRTIDLHVHNDPGRPVPPAILDAVRAEGLTVYTTAHHGVIERPEAWLPD